MYRIIDKRDTGKTSRLFLLAKENNGIIVCGHPQAMIEKAKAYGINDLEFKPYSWLTNNNIKGLHRPIFIDEIDLYLQYTVSTDIKGYTLTIED